MTDTLTPQQRRRTMQRVRSKDTAPEKAVRSLLHHMGYRFRLHGAKLPGKPDIVLTRHKAVVFVHGCFWHQHSCARGSRRPASNSEYWNPKLDRTVERDRRRVRELRSLGWRVLVIWECQVAGLTALESRLRRFLAPR